MPLAQYFKISVKEAPAITLSWSWHWEDKQLKSFQIEREWALSSSDRQPCDQSRGSPGARCWWELSIRITRNAQSSALKLNLFDETKFWSLSFNDRILQYLFIGLMTLNIQKRLNQTLLAHTSFTYFVINVSSLLHQIKYESILNISKSINRFGSNHWVVNVINQFWQYFVRGRYAWLNGASTNAAMPQAFNLTVTVDSRGQCHAAPNKGTVRVQWIRKYNFLSSLGFEGHIHITTPINSPFRYVPIMIPISGILGTFLFEYFNVAFKLFSSRLT